jgi:hypothetical protein
MSGHALRRQGQTQLEIADSTDSMPETQSPTTYWGYTPGKRRNGGQQPLLCDGYTDVVDADLSKYFDTIPHWELLQCVARRIVDRNMLRLIKLWLKVPVEEQDRQGKRHLTGGQSSRCGSPQGGIVTPLTQKVIWGAWLYWRWATAWRETLRNWNAVANRDGVFSYQYLFHHKPYDSLALTDAQRISGTL